MFDGILDERLEQQGRQQADLGILLNLFVHPQAVAETNFLNGHVFFQEFKLVRKAHQVFFA